MQKATLENLRLALNRAKACDKLFKTMSNDLEVVRRLVRTLPCTSKYLYSLGEEKRLSRSEIKATISKIKAYLKSIRDSADELSHDYEQVSRISLSLMSESVERILLSENPDALLYRVVQSIGIIEPLEKNNACRIEVLEKHIEDASQKATYA